MSFDAYLVSFGLARVLIEYGVPPGVAYQLMLVTAVIDTGLLWSFFRAEARLRRALKDNLSSGVPQGGQIAEAGT